MPKFINIFILWTRVQLELDKLANTEEMMVVNKEKMVVASMEEMKAARVELVIEGVIDLWFNYPIITIRVNGLL